MLLLAYRNLRTRPARTIFTALAIALGVGMIFAMRIVTVTLGETSRLARENRLAGADLEVTSASGARLPASLADELAERPEIEIAAPVLRGLEGAPDPSAQPGLTGIALKGTGLALLGVDPARNLLGLEGEALTVGTSFSAPDAYEVILPAAWAAGNGLGLDADITLVTGQQTHTYRIVGLSKTASGPAQDQPTAWLPLKTLQTVFDAPGAATSVLLRLRPGAPRESTRQQLQGDLGAQFIVVSADGQSGGLRSIFDLTNVALPFAGFAVLLGGAFLVFNAFAITLAERRREIGQLRTLGMTRGQVLGQTLSEAALTALLGSAIGLLLGWGLGRGVTLIIRQLQGDSAVPDVPVPMDGILLGVGAGLLVTVAVTFSLAWGASRVSPLEALKPTTDMAARKRRFNWPVALSLVGAGLLALAAFLILQVETYMREAPNADLLVGLAPSLLPVFAPLCFLPLAVDIVLWLWERLAASRPFRAGGLLSHLGVTARLAAGSAGRQRGRIALTATALTLGLTLTIFFSGYTLAVAEYFRGLAGSMVAADFVLIRSMPPGVTFADAARLPPLPPLEPGLQAELDALEDTARLGYLANVSLPGLGLETGNGDQYSFALTIERIKNTPMFPAAEGSWDEAEQYFAAGPAVLLPELTARRLNKHPGDVIEVDTLRGKTPFTVALAGGAFPVVNHEIAQAYFDSYPSMILIDAQGDQAQLREKLKSLAEQYNLLYTEDIAAEMQQRIDQLLGPIVGLFTGLTSLTGVIAGLGVVVTLIASVLERQRELGTLRALGMSRAHVRSVIVIEAALIGLVGAGLGAAGGLMLAYVFVWDFKILMEGLTGATQIQNIVLPWPVAVGALVIGPAMTMLTALWPADRAASVNPADAMRAEGATGFLPAAKHLGPTGLRGLAARMPLSAKLSLGIGLVLVLTVAALTVIRANYERQLLEDNISAMLGRLTDTAMDSNRDQLPPEVAELTPQILLAMQQQAGAQAEALRAQFQQGGSEYDFTLEYLFIADPDLKVIYSDRPEFVGRTLTETIPLNSPSAAVRITDWTGERVFEAVAPIENRAGKRVGIFQAGLSTAPIDNFIRQVLEGSLGVTVAALALAIGLTVFFTRRALAPVAQIAQASNAVARGDLSQRIPETRWDEVGRLSRSFNDMVKGLNERERIRDLFGRYVSREVQEEVLAGRVTLRGERKTITVLYVDMRGSTTFAESHAPEDVMAALNQYFEVIILATEAYGGIVNRFVGDEAVCVFGAPTEIRDHAERAVQAALAMREGLAYVNQKRTALGQPVLKFGMGLNTGEVTAGATGSEERQEYTVIGDAMNLGARIQDLNKTFPDYGILLSEFTLAALGPCAEDYEFADLGAAEIRGKTQPVRVYGLVGRREKTD
jgi:ABC-type antimicrobial peptide transport system permease subunit/class 3 adenylate cyclase